MYKVLIEFADLQDKEHVYLVGDEFPRKGFSVSDERIKELSTATNRRGVPLIEEVMENEPEQPENTEINEASSEDDKVITKKKRVRKTAKNG